MKWNASCMHVAQRKLAWKEGLHSFAPSLTLASVSGKRKVL